ncbi:DUF2303 family protein [Oharaeibacter diazotrophicus]|uniref:Uncharacterized protein DUF2303 n=1 Tax=Oharaeibacter diazotrophicus TaxID=1920512 RepID=A0A4R6RGG5_9HYPH|nr:DUF2303 family protein [Oharaeibacter diazotrophicus]TDP85362.1 uncharacterized protein DUF2303 [Oharaeibacter diazotrophicus]BBE74332.1 hypothetical protein OHA_1_03963 [Pleomorphomonas sp. SM30]GLS75977.1 hypothetical protein GCM10007904_13120 [Oharaeibacter diazotrophicus]
MTDEQSDIAAAEGQIPVLVANPLQIPAGADGVEAIAELAAKANAFDLRWLGTDGLGTNLPPEVPILYDAAKGQVRSIRPEIEAYRLGPDRRRGTAEVTTLKSFADLLDRHKDEGSAVFAVTTWPEPRFVGVVDYHDLDNEPRHMEHRIVYRFPLTPEFKTWVEMNGKRMEQALFAAFLEEHAAELAAPTEAEIVEYERLFKERFATPAHLLELSRSLEVFVGAKAKRAERLQTGERTVEFVEEHRNGAGEKIEIPGIFMVSVPAFLDGDPIRIPARLRYRLGAGTIEWFYQLYRWDFWLRDRVQQDLLWVAKQTELPCFEGTPETTRSGA